MHEILCSSHLPAPLSLLLQGQPVKVRSQLHVQKRVLLRWVLPQYGRCSILTFLNSIFLSGMGVISKFSHPGLLVGESCVWSVLVGGSLFTFSRLTKEIFCSTPTGQPGAIQAVNAWTWLSIGESQTKETSETKELTSSGSLHRATVFTCEFVFERSLRSHQSFYQSLPSPF